MKARSRLSLVSSECLFRNQVCMHAGLYNVSLRLCKDHNTFKAVPVGNCYSHPLSKWFSNKFTVTCI